jgi:lactate dehydrogenase-like 2-hydroxyacid dehydrogenase
MNVVVLDAGRLAGEADFPMLDLPKFGWQQYPESAEAEVPELCWRSDIIVSVATPIDKAVIDKAFKLKLIVAAGDSTAHIDTAAAAERGIKVCNVPGADPANRDESARICNTVVEKIDSFLKQLAE